MPSDPNQSRQFFAQLAESTQRRDIVIGKAIHARILKSARSSCAHLGNSLVNLYAKCGYLRIATLVFDNLTKKDLVSWNCLINAVAAQNDSSSRSSMAMGLLRRMRRENATPDAFTFSRVFVAAASGGTDVLGGRQSHAAAIKAAGFADVFLGSSLVNLYCKAGLVVDARKVFDEMPARNSVSWGTMISGYGRERMSDDALELFGRLRCEEVEFDGDYVFTSVLSALVVPGVLASGRQIHCLTEKNGASCFVPVGNALLTMYAKCGSLDDAIRVFESSNEKNATTWSAMVTGLVQSGDPQNGLKLFSNMHSSGVTPSEFTLVGLINACSDNEAIEEGKQLHGYSIRLGFESHIYTTAALVDMYARCGSVIEARMLFDNSQVPDCALWNSMIGGYVISGDNEGALSLYCRMQMEGIAPNEPTMASVLKACSNLAALEQGKQIHAHAIKHGFSLEIPIGSALSTMYTKCGNLGDGGLVFSRMPTRDLISWNAMISGFSQNGRGYEALKLFDEMLSEGMKPNHVTFVNVLSSCSHMGSVDAAWSYFNSMIHEFSLAPMVEHYACMVDVLSRAGRLKEAKDLIESATVDHGIPLWRVLLGACRNHQDYELGAYAGEKLMELGSRESSTYVLLSSIYTCLGRKEDVERVKRTMKLQGVSKEPGCSWIELKSGVHVFVVGDELHPQIGCIHVEIRRLRKHMKDQYYVSILDDLTCAYSCKTL